MNFAGDSGLANTACCAAPSNREVNVSSRRPLVHRLDGTPSAAGRLHVAATVYCDLRQASRPHFEWYTCSAPRVVWSYSVSNMTTFETVGRLSEAHRFAHV